MPLGRRPAFGWSRWPASNRRWSFPTPACTSSALPCSRRSTRSPSRSTPPFELRSASRRATPRTGSWSHLPPSASSPTSPRNGRCSPSSTTPSGSTAPRVRSSVSRRGGCWRSPWRSCSQCAREATTKDSSSACPRCRSTGSRTRTRAHCSRRSCPGDSTRAYATGSSPRRVEIRSLCWSCREG